MKGRIFWTVLKLDFGDDADIWTLIERPGSVLSLLQCHMKLKITFQL